MVSVLRGPSERPTLDQRRQQSWLQQLPSRLSTSLAWLGAAALLGPIKLPVVLIAGSLIAPILVVDERCRRRPAQRQVSPSCDWAAQISWLADPLERSVSAQQMTLTESQLFRARHASVCTVHHDDVGSIVALELALPSPLPSIRQADAHPVG